MIKRTLKNIIEFYKSDLPLEERAYQYKALYSLSAVISVIFLFIGSIIMPIKYGFNNMFNYPNFYLVNSLFIICALIHLYTRRQKEAGWWSYILPIALMIASSVGFHSEKILLETPYVPFYAMTLFFVSAGVLLNIKQFTIITLIALPLYSLNLFSDYFDFASFLHRSALIFIAPPFMFIATSIRHKNFKSLEEQSKKLVEKTNMQTLAELSASLAHEINNPLAIISGFVQRLRRLNNQGTLSPEEIENLLSRADLTLERITRIIRGLKKLSYTGNKKLFAEESIPNIVLDGVSLYEGVFREKGITASYDLPDAGEMIQCDSVQITQIIINLTSNAIDATSSAANKWIRFDAKITSDDFVEFAVTDSGPGVSSDVKNQLFKPFFTTKEMGKGTGLGLSLCLRIARLHGGDFYLDELSNNTRFVLKLPRNLNKTEAA